MCVYFPRWPLQRLWLLRPDLRHKPVAIMQPQTRGGACVTFCCDLAREAGVRPGMPVAEARAVNRRLSIHEANPAADVRGLQRLAVWAERYSPVVGLEDGPTPHSLLVDVTGCAGYFHGEDRLAKRALQELHDKELSVRTAIANTVGAAWAFAHHVRSWYVSPAIDPGLTQLPLTALRLPDEALQMLGKLGVERIEQLQALPRSTLNNGFGPIVLERLDQALGRLPEPIVPQRVLPEVQARWSFENPVERRSFVDYALNQLIQQVAATLRERNRGARQLECTFYHENTPPLRIDVGLYRPSRSPEHLEKLVQARLEEVSFEEPIHGIGVRVAALEFVPEHQGRLFDGQEASGGELSRLVDQLVSRLGRRAVTFPTLVPDPQPEFACRFQPAIALNKRKKPEWTTTCFPAQRPLQMRRIPLPIDVLLYRGQPRHIRRAAQDYAVVRSWGPERIDTGWWRGQDVHRDYYTVETADGTRWWIFHRHEDGRWFLHGCFE